MDGGQDERLFHVLDLLHRREQVGALDGDHVSADLVHPVDDGRGGGDQLKVELALQPLLDDLHVEQAEKAAAEAEAEGERGLGLVGEGGIIQLELGQRVAQLLVLDVSIG